MINESIIYIRNKITGFLYKNLLKPIFFLVEPENMHDGMTLIGRLLGSNSLTRQLTKLLFFYSHPSLEQTILGIQFSNPIGLAAGFDKNARLTNILPSVGFGFTEVGTITGEKCDGNPKPRLWRLIKSKSLVVYYGLKNDGSEKISARLKNQKFNIPVITSIGKTNNLQTVGVEDGIRDYVKAYRHFTGIGHFFDINISCPNTFGGTPFSDPAKFHKLMTQIDKISIPISTKSDRGSSMAKRIGTHKPVFIKMPPDLTDHEVDEILKVARKHQIAGFICCNLTKKRKQGILDQMIPKDGGLSGKLVEDLANHQIQRIYQKTKGKYIIIGCGGVFSAKDAYKKIKLGATLVQLITGMIFEGPQLISEINQGLVRLLQKDGYKNISEAIGQGL